MRRCRPWLGTLVDIEVDDVAHAGVAVEEAFRAVEAVDRLMSFHRDDSELSRINRLAPGSSCMVHEWTAEVLALCLELRHASGGLFDCDIGRVLQNQGSLPATRIDVGHVVAGGPGVGFELIRRDGRPVVRVHRRVRLDLGGIAKGYAVDQAIEALARAGIEEAIVNAGGDLRVAGRRPRPIVLRDPVNPRLLHPIGELADGAIATSSGCFTQAIVDPRRSGLARLDASISVLASRCAVADGLTKIVALAGRLDGELANRYSAACLIHEARPDAAADQGR